MDQVLVDVKPHPVSLAPLVEVGAPNTKTVDAIRQLEAGGDIGFGSVEALMADLEADD